MVERVIIGLVSGLRGTSKAGRKKRWARLWVEASSKVVDFRFGSSANEWRLPQTREETVAIKVIL